MSRRKCPDCGEEWDALTDERCRSCGLSIDDLERATDFVLRVQARDVLAERDELRHELRDFGVYGDWTKEATT